MVEAREAAERFARQPATMPLDPRLKAQLRDVGRALPTLWASGRLDPLQKKELLRSLIRRIIVTRPVPDTIEAKLVWVSGAVTPVAVHPPILRGADVSRYEAFVARVLELGAAGHHDREIAARLTAEGYHSARRSKIPPSWVGEIRRARGQISLTGQFRTQAKLDGQWTIFGLAQALGVHRNWLYARIRNGVIPAVRHPVVGQFLIPDDPTLLQVLTAHRERCAYR